jgi:hypothetical protein
MNDPFTNFLLANPWSLKLLLSFLIIVNLI